MSTDEYDEERRTLEVLARALAGTLHADFALLVFGVGDEGRVINYVSNTQRGESVDVMKEFVARNERPVDVS